MGSRSTNLKCGIGGWKGRALITGDYLPFCTRNLDFMANLGSHTVERDDDFYGFDADEITLRVVPGPQEDMFTQDGIDTFYGQKYTTTSRCDRMGFRLDGPEIETYDGSDIISDGIALGAVQIPADGRPIIMFADRQTTGGYAKIGTVCSVDLPKLVQCTPGRTIRFAPVTVQEAQELYRQEARRLGRAGESGETPVLRRHITAKNGAKTDAHPGSASESTRVRKSETVDRTGQNRERTPAGGRGRRKRHEPIGASMSTNETNAETTLHQQEMQQRRENILDLLDIMDEGNLTALRFKDGSMEIELERTPAPAQHLVVRASAHGRARRTAAQRPRGRFRA